MADDATRERPPGHRAQNWSRRDGIRAGAVSGPWRSAPRADAPEQLPPRPSAAGRAAGPAADAGPPPARAAGAPAAGRRPVLVAVLGGAAVAAALVGAAVLMRPAAPPPAPEPAAVVAPEPVALPATGDAASAPDAEPAGADSGAADLPALLASPATLRLRVGPETSEARTAAIVAALEAAGARDVAVERTAFRIAVSRVGFYREADVGTAEALAARMSPVLDDPAGPVAVRDYSKLVPDAEPGRLDLWVADRGAAE